MRSKPQTKNDLKISQREKEKLKLFWYWWKIQDNEWKDCLYSWTVRNGSQSYRFFLKAKNYIETLKKE